MNEPQSIPEPQIARRPRVPRTIQWLGNLCAAIAVAVAAIYATVIILYAMGKP